MIKYADCDPKMDELFELINDIYATGIVPTDFQITKTVTLPKKITP